MFEPEALKKILRQAEASETTDTNQTIRMMAKELAGIFYEDQARSPKFRKAFPTFRHYMRGQWIQADGSIKAYRPGWLHHVELARKMLSASLHEKSSMHDHLKWATYYALIDDRGRAMRPSAKKLHQVGIDGYQT